MSFSKSKNHEKANKKATFGSFVRLSSKLLT